jgi:hypothetical protein
MDRRRFLGLGLATAGAALLPRTGWTAPSNQPDWTSTQLWPRYRYAVGSVGSRVVVAGGTHYDGPKSMVTDHADVYDAATNSWSTTKMGHPRVYARAIAAGSRLLVVGWRDDNGFTESVDIYDSERDSWTYRELQLGKEGFMMAKAGETVAIRANLPDGSSILHTYDGTTDAWTSQPAPPRPRGAELFVAGSIILNRRDAEIWDTIDLFDTATGAWSAISLPTPRMSVTVQSVGSLVLFAGGARDLKYVDTVDIYDTVTGSWSTAHLAEARGVPTPARIGERVIFAGGSKAGPERSVPSQAVDIFDAASGTWSTGQIARHDRSLMATVSGDHVLFTSWTADVDVYDAAADRWGATQLSVARERYSVASVGKYVLFAGGSQYSPYKTLRKHVDTVDVYDTASETWSVRRLQKARETPAAAVVGSRALFIGGELMCEGCGPTALDPFVDMFDADLA